MHLDLEGLGLRQHDLDVINEVAYWWLRGSGGVDVGFRA